MNSGGPSGGGARACAGDAIVSNALGNAAASTGRVATTSAGGIEKSAVTVDGATECPPALIFWQQSLRVERLVLPKRLRFFSRLRRAIRRRRPALA